MSNDSPGFKRPQNLDLSKLSFDEILQLRDRIVHAAQAKIDPQSVDFRPVMETDDGTFFGTDDVAFKDWWDWVEQIIRTVSDGLTRIALGVTVAGLAIASGLMYGSPATGRYADLTLGAAGVLGVFFVALTLRSTLRGR